MLQFLLTGGKFQPISAGPFLCTLDTYLHTYIPTYLHTYIHTYIHTYSSYIPQMEQHEPERWMLFRLGNVTYLLDVTPSNPLPHPLSPPCTHSTLCYLSSKFWLLSSIQHTYIHTHIHTYILQVLLLFNLLICTTFRSLVLCCTQVHKQVHSTLSGEWLSVCMQWNSHQAF